MPMANVNANANASASASAASANVTTMRRVVLIVHSFFLSTNPTAIQLQSSKSCYEYHSI